MVPVGRHAAGRGACARACARELVARGCCSLGAPTVQPLPLAGHDGTSRGCTYLTQVARRHTGPGRRNGEHVVARVLLIRATPLGVSAFAAAVFPTLTGGAVDGGVVTPVAVGRPVRRRRTRWRGDEVAVAEPMRRRAVRGANGSKWAHAATKPRCRSLFVANRATHMAQPSEGRLVRRMPQQVLLPSRQLPLDTGHERACAVGATAAVGQAIHGEPHMRRTLLR